MNEFLVYHTNGSLSGGANNRQSPKPMVITANDENEAETIFNSMMENKVYNRKILKIKEGDCLKWKNIIMMNQILFQQ